jgi:hypothetical protein
MTKNDRFSPYICVIEMILILLQDAALTAKLYYHTDLNLFNFRHEFLVNKTNRCTEFQLYWY